MERQELPFSLAEYKDRVDKVRISMEKFGVKVLLISAPENIYYLSGYQTLGYFSFQLLFVMADREPVLLTRHLNVENAQLNSWLDSVEGYTDTENPIL